VQHRPTGTSRVPSCKRSDGRMDKLISEPSAIIGGSAAWLLSRVLRSPDIRRVLDNPPGWIERGDITAMVTAVDLAARAFVASQPAPRRGKMTPLGAVVPESEWSTRQAAEYLGISRRRVQELAEELGGQRVGQRQWLLPEIAVREYERRKKTG
jgi:excisionase family DNA binding protein